MYALWEVWEVKFLLLSSLVVQVLLFIVTDWRRCVSCRPLLSVVLNGILWLLYQMADSVALYVLGHMSLSSKPRDQQQLTAFWASLLLVHLGGQDTITAYAMEDNKLWLRHLFTLMVQATGAAFVLYKYVNGGSRALLGAAVLMLLVGFVKYLERIYALYSSRLDSISKFLDGAEVLEPNKVKEYQVPANFDDEEEVLEGAHDLLHICMGQLVDYKVWPSKYQNGAILAYHRRIWIRNNPNGTSTRSSSPGRSRLLQLLGMQLSLMRDILYTKAAVIHTWYGFVSRIISTIATILAFYLFHQSAIAGAGYSKGDMMVTYILLAGALLLEVASMSRAAASTWTCAWLRDAGWNRTHAAALYLRRQAKEAQRCRKWSGSIRQHDMSVFDRYGKSGTCYWIASLVGLEHEWKSLRLLQSVEISHDVEDLLLREVQYMVEACKGDEHTLWSYRGQLVREAWGAELSDGGTGLEHLGFDGSILAWHYATDAFLRFFDMCNMDRATDDAFLRFFDVCSKWVPNMLRTVRYMTTQRKERVQGLAEAIRTLSRYLLFLLVERPHLLPSPVRRSQYDRFCAGFQEFMQIDHENVKVSDAIKPGVDLTSKLIYMCEREEASVEDILSVISAVWVQMLCYAANHSSNDAHASQLSSGTELITVVWILITALFNNHYSDKQWFREKVSRVAYTSFLTTPAPGPARFPGQSRSANSVPSYLA
ncbi:hypothetical protein ZWY2020_013160 [Hordeum vulgare]|nr:hypothetical protein ZWY2020_013160 [Hordeum vulgare]